MTVPGLSQHWLGCSSECSRAAFALAAQSTWLSCSSECSRAAFALAAQSTWPGRRSCQPTSLTCPDRYTPAASAPRGRSSRSSAPESRTSRESGPSWRLWARGWCSFVSARHPPAAAPACTHAWSSQQPTFTVRMKILNPLRMRPSRLPDVSLLRATMGLQGHTRHYSVPCTPSNDLNIPHCSLLTELVSRQPHRLASLNMINGQVSQHVLTSACHQSTPTQGTWRLLVS